MKIGITGTREGATERQIKALYDFFVTVESGSELHHGDCCGVDVQAAIIASELGIKTVCHPPISNELRAFHESTEIKKPEGYLKRDRAIVDHCDVLVVVPLQDSWQPAGGTWYTHDYAQKKEKTIIVYYPTL